MTLTGMIEVGLLIVMFVVPGLVVWSRVRKHESDGASPRGIGVRVIQLVSLFLFTPLIGILALEGKISGETVGSLIGVAIGYILSGVERAVPHEKHDKMGSKTERSPAGPRAPA